MDTKIARRILVTDSSAYRVAFAKYVAGRPLNDEDKRALEPGAAADGGYAVPFAVDPTIPQTWAGMQAEMSRLLDEASH